MVAILLAAAVAVASIALALVVTPTSPVRTVGQTVRVGATAPSLTLSGPGEVDLFGQRLPTKLRFAGPIRPRLVLTRITLSRQLASLVGRGQARAPERAIGRALAAGWVHYFLSETAVAGGFSLLFVGAIAGWRRRSWRRTAVLLAVGLLLVEVINLGAVMLTAYSAPGRLRHVTSLEALVGSSPLPPVPPAGRVRPGIQAVVMGDSTAAGLGNAALASPSPEDRACGRSADTYAGDLAEANGWRVLNLGCSGATVEAGLLGPQVVGGTSLPAQLAVAKQATAASVVIVSIGADDLQWSSIIRLCAVAATCSNAASTTYFQQQLAAFTPRYYELLQQLSELPAHPRVVINLYYNPFDPTRDCLGASGLTAGKERSLVAFLDALNSVLADGAQASSFTAVRPPFAGHALCDPEPYVQGLKDPAPFHPTAAGELAIALADEQALAQTGASSPGAETRQVVG
jgi:lysophospholipase L1-like esterase